jgi:sulfur carrier protein
MNEDPPTITITVNGEERAVAAATTITDLLEAAGLSPQVVAVEVNRRLRRGDRYDEALAAGDVVEIVTFVGGG